MPLASSLGVPAVWAQPAPADAPGWSTDDEAGDVRPVDPTTAPAGLGASALADLVDIRELRFHKETGLDFEVLYGLQSLELALPQGRLGVLHMICFRAHGTLLAIRSTYSYDDAGLPQSLFATLVKQPGADCNTSFNGPGPQLDALLDLETDTLRFLVPKTAIVEHLGPSGNLVMGDQITGIQAFSRTLQVGGTAYFLLADAAPDDGPSPDGPVMRYHIHNRDLRVAAPTASQMGVLQCSGLKRPVISIEGGRYQGIPILVENLAPNALAADLSASVEPATWEAKVIPRIDLPAGTAEGSGNVTLTLIVKSPDADGKSCAEVRVMAMDPGDPTRMGELVLDIVSAPTPGPAAKQLYLHTRPDTQRPPRIWMNAAPEDPSAQADMAVRLIPVTGTQVGSSSVVQLTALGDGVYPFDLLLQANGVARANLFLRSEAVPTPAKIVLELTSGGERLAGGEAEVEIPAGGQLLPIDMIVDPDLWKNPQRRAAAEQPFGLVLRYEPTGRVPTVRGQGSSYVDFVPGQSSIELPIVERVLAKDVRLGDGGGLVSLRLADGLANKLTNEARGNFFNFTVTNEGVAVDSFTYTATLTAEPALAWTVLSQPATRLDDIAPGQSGTLSLLVTAPDLAPEAAEARIRVVVASQTDDAQATSLITVRVAKQQEHGLLLDAPAIAADDTPGPALAAALAALALAAFARRRR